MCVDAVAVVVVLTVEVALVIAEAVFAAVAVTVNMQPLQLCQYKEASQTVQRPLWVTRLSWRFALQAATCSGEMRDLETARGFRSRIPGSRVKGATTSWD